MVYFWYVFSLPSVEYFCVFPYTVLNALGPKKFKRSYKGGKKLLSTFGVTFYFIVIKVFYRICRVFSKIALSSFNNTSDFPFPQL